MAGVAFPGNLVRSSSPGSQLGPRAHAAVWPNKTAGAEAGVHADDCPLEDAAALAEGRARLDDGVGRDGAAVADGCVGMDGGRGVDDGMVADGGSGLDDGGGDPGPEGWVGWSSRMAVGTLFATGSMSPHPPPVIGSARQGHLT